MSEPDQDMQEYQRLRGTGFTHDEAVALMAIGTSQTLEEAQFHAAEAARAYVNKRGTRSRLNQAVTSYELWLAIERNHQDDNSNSPGD